MKKEVPGENALNFRSSEVSWATSRYIDKRIGFAQKIFIHTLSTTIIILTVYAYFTKIALTFNASGKLATVESVVKVKSEGSFIPSQVYVSSGQMVEQGQVIAESTNAIGKLAIENINTYVDQIKNNLKQDRCPDCLIKLNSIKSKLFRDIQGNTALGQLNKTTIALNNYILRAETLYDFDNDNKNLMSQLKTTINKINRINKQRAQRLLRVELEGLRQQKDEIEAKITQQKDSAKAGYQTALEELNNSLSELPGIIKNINQQNIVFSPSKGIVSNSQIEQGQLIQAGQDLMEIVPINSDLKAEIFVLNKDIAELKNGQQVKLNIDAYPEREYGSLYGEVSKIAANSQSIENIGEVYQVDVSLKQQFVSKNNQNYPLKLGMTLTGKVIKKRERLLTVGIRKLLNLKDEMLGD